MEQKIKSIKKRPLSLGKITVVSLDKSPVNKIWESTNNAGAQQFGSTRPECDVTNTLTITSLSLL
ncbi:hypothetical protein [Chitinophaga sp. sic0106]|uniref:hypothetical protein n=1 Tax=Chitinophaga sp. sic0106 TaxID=2854785 RepID=UPI001C4607FA|nr:hypothetical protein [Chitinophaga sp. sic0106]MBV7529433.1 hypothetical protein [Chitinophaga sp. sic0106]